MATRPAQLWRALSVRPAGISLRTSCHALAAMLAVVGALLAMSGLPEASVNREARLLALWAGVISFLLAALIIVAWRWLPLSAFFAIHAGESALLGHVVHHANTSTAAVTGGMLFILLVVPATTAHDVAEIVDRVRAGLLEGRTMSVGVDLAPAARPLSDMVQRADQALYQVKRSRRGATRVFGADLDALPASA